MYHEKIKKVKFYSYFDGKTQFSQIFLGFVIFLFFFFFFFFGGGGGSNRRIFHLCFVSFLKEGI